MKFIHQHLSNGVSYMDMQLIFLIYEKGPFASGGKGLNGTLHVEERWITEVVTLHNFSLDSNNLPLSCQNVSYQQQFFSDLLCIQIFAENAH